MASKRTLLNSRSARFIKVNSHSTSVTTHHRQSCLVPVATLYM